MPNLISPSDRLVVNRLLSRTADMLDGSLDFWTVVCLGQDGLEARGFLEKYGEELRSLSVISKVFWSNAYFEPMLQVLRKYQDAFLSLADYRKKSLEDLQKAVNCIKEGYVFLQKAVDALEKDLGEILHCRQKQTPERKQYFQGILDRLFETFCQARTEPMDLVPSGSTA